MCWANCPFEFRAQRSRMDRGAWAVGIHRRRGRGEDHLDAFAAEHLEVGVEGARVGVQILARPELQRVDENRGHHHSAWYPLGRMHKRHVALVQCAHGRNQHDPPPGMAQRPGDIGNRARGRIDVELPGAELRRFGRHAVGPWGCGPAGRVQSSNTAKTSSGA